MLLVCIILSLMIIILAIRWILQVESLRKAVKQMENIEKQPNTNHQLKALPFGVNLEALFTKINDLYLARQQERIIYQRRERQIRREIENISHDLRTPLTSILGYIELIQHDELDETEKEEYLNIIKLRAKVLQGFIQDFYELSRIEGENYPLVLEKISIQDIIAEVAVAYYKEFEEKKISVELQLEEAKVFIIGDRTQLNRVLGNLIGNALKYSKNNFVIKQFSSNKDCILQFINEKGMLTDLELNQLFDRFYCGDYSRSNQSTGLGLTISKILVDRMKGKIEARIEGEMLVIELRFQTYS